MKLYYIVNARLPNKKAYGIQVAKMCEAFIESGVDLTLVIPNTRAARSATLKDFYHLRVDVPTVILPGIDGYASGHIPFLVSSLWFALVSGFYISRKRRGGEKAIVYTVDMDTFSFAFLPLSGLPVVAEMHDTKPSNFLTRYFFKHARLIVATNSEIKNSLRSLFKLAEEKFIVEPNGVDFAAFSNEMSRDEARRALSLPQDKKIALYVGRFFEWKGLQILSEASSLASDIEWYVVGGTSEEFRSATGVENIPQNLPIAGECKTADVPTWLYAADALVILGTKENERSYRHTAPMKVFEYMAARRPIVASATPALRSIIPEDCVQFYRPDDAHSLADTVRRAVTSRSDEMLDRADDVARDHSWNKRGERILAVIRFRV